MIRFAISPARPPSVRIAWSALWECVSSVRVLRDPASHAPLAPWIRRAGAARPADVRLLGALVRGDGGYVPDFLAPPPSGPGLTFETELKRLRATPPSVVRAEVGRSARQWAPAAAVLARFHRDPRGLRDTIADALERYWTSSLAPEWPRLAALLEGEVLGRARMLALGGPQSLLNALHPAITYGSDGIAVDSPQNATVRAPGTDLLLVPSVFAWPDVFTVHDPAWRASIYYPARGVGTLWDEGRAKGDADALALLAGSGRGGVLRTVATPSTTRELALRLGLAASSVSAHLHRLSRAGLLERVRVGHHVFYRRSVAGEAVVEAIDARLAR